MDQYSNILLSTRKYKAQRDYWIESLWDAQVDYLFHSHGNYSDAPVTRADFGRCEWLLPTGTAQKILKLSKNSDETLFIVLLSAFLSFLYKYTGKEDVFSASPVYKGIDNRYLFNDFVVFRKIISPHTGFKDMLMDMRERFLDICENQDYPFDKIIEELNTAYKRPYDALLDILFASEHIHSMESIQHRRSSLSLSFRRDNDTICFAFRFNKLYYTVEKIDSIGRYFSKILTHLVDDLTIKLSQLEILSDEEKKQVLLDFNNTAALFPAQKTIHQVFAEQVMEKPGNKALLGSDSLLPMSYEELNRKSNRLAHVLRAKGLRAGNLAGVMSYEPREMMVGILAILKAGGAYLPLDPDYPGERISYMLDDADTGFLLIPASLQCDISFHGEIIGFDDGETDPAGSSNPVNMSKSEDPAYVIYTSGSTGKPKGVLIEHRSVVNLVFAQERVFNIDETDRVLLFSSFCFDASVEQVFITLFSGAGLVLIDKATLLDAHKFEEYISTYSVTHIHAVPSFLESMELGKPYCLRRIIAGGDVCPGSLAARWYRHCSFYNEYGPTETTVTSIESPVERIENNSGAAPIGKPIANTVAYILDKWMNPTPYFVAGELYIGGVGVARGYLNNPEKTIEKFIVDPFTHGGRLFRTGDFARWRPDGNIEFLGRMDHQVKIRGFRIELEEIEARLLKKEGITMAAVVLKEDKKKNTDEGKYLCAYFSADRRFTVHELRDFLSASLPPYMLPSYFVPLAKFPLNINGKIDRKSLPQPDGISLDSDTGYRPPRNIIEKTLAETWEQVLGRNGIGIEDNFFLIGGDSIKTIQVASRLNMAGYKLEMRDIFQNPTISHLAPLVRKLEQIAEQSAVTGIAPLTPIQARFFNSHKIESHHFNQAVMLYSCLDEGFEEQAVRTIFTKIQEHHDALRMTFKESEGKIIQENHGSDYPISLQVLDLRNRENAAARFAEAVNELQASIDLEKGPLMKLGLFHLDDGDRLLIVIHHLAIDAVSWRILFEDIETLYRQYKKGEVLALPLKTDSYKLWAENLSAFADSEECLKQEEYWRSLEVDKVPRIPADFVPGSNIMRTRETHSFSLNEVETEALLTKANAAFNTEVNDLLLTALGSAFRKIFGCNRLLLALEGHGREEILKDIDIKRTVGWFTAVYPVILDFSYANDLSRQLKEIKETLRAVPYKGIGYGILEYLVRKNGKDRIEPVINPQLNFNYLGQFDADLEQTSFRIADEAVGNTVSMAQQREFEIEVIGLIKDKKLVMSIEYNGKQYKNETISMLWERYRTELSRIISYCSVQEKRELTPSDLTYNRLSIETLDRLNKRYDIADIYILASMQEGMLFHALYDNAPTMYLEQFNYRFHGELHVELVEKSVNEIFKRYDMLRTVFLYEELERPLQLVLRERQVDFKYIDLRKLLADRNDRGKYIEDFKAKDRNHGFDLSKDVLLRIAILQLDRNEYEMLWTHHHILWDGWCIEILFSEYREIYNSYLQGREYRLPDVIPYRNYCRWLENRDKKEAKKYWGKYLEGFETPTVIPVKKSVGTFKEVAKNEYVVLRLSKEKTDRLNKLAVKNRVTLNTIVHTVWGILLGRYVGSRDVVFGAVVSGRPAEVLGVEKMIGLFTNTIPVRVRCTGDARFCDLLYSIQQETIESQAYHYFQLAEIQAVSTLKQQLFDHLIEFENILVEERLKELLQGLDTKKGGGKLKISNLEHYSQNNYTFDMIMRLDEELSVTFRFNNNVHDSNFVKKIPHHFNEVIDQALENCEIALEDIKISHELLVAASNIQRQDRGDFGF